MEGEAEPDKVEKNELAEEEEKEGEEMETSAKEIAYKARVQNKNAY